MNTYSKDSLSAVAAVVLNYRRTDLTLTCINSLLDQVAVIAVVDNSADSHYQQELVEALDRLSLSINSPTRIEYVPTEHNLGFAQGIQKGLDHLVQSEDWNAFLIINNDATAEPGMLEQLMHTFEHHGKNAVIAPERCADGTPSIRWYQRTLALVLDRKAPGTFMYLNGACLLVPACLVKPFLFDPTFFMYGEDVELSWRLMQRGVLLLTSPCRYSHIGNASSGPGSAFYEYCTARGHFLLARKLAKNRWDFAKLFLGRCLSLPARALLRSVRNRSIAPILAILKASTQPPPLS
jgi:N-acetylglucosaminyl-diphospho-decaprenol L-rhamnosyltransferase